MRLYKAELYKLLHNKRFWIGEACVIGILLFFFRIKVSDESATVGGITYRGYEAVQMNRRITEEYKGVLTDEKAASIIEKYGFPQEADEATGSFRDSNFLNQFVMTYLSDGYADRYKGCRIATQIYPIADTQLGAVQKLTGEEVILEYSNGWLTFKDFWDMGMLLGSIIILFTISVVFASESQTKMQPLLFTAKEGRQKDIYMKIAAAFTISAGIWLEVILLDLVLCGLVYSFDGLDCFTGIISVENGISTEVWETMLPVKMNFMIAALCSLAGVLLLCGVIIWISANFRSSFHAIITAMVFLWVSPNLVRVLFNVTGIWDHLFGSGIVLACIGSLISIFFSILASVECQATESWLMQISLSIAAAVLCTVAAYRKYRRQQVC